MFNFEKHDVWHSAIDYADLVYSLTRNFPNDERFGLTNQMRRAAVSKIDFVRFVEIATGSLYEVVSEATIGLRQGFIDQANYNKLYDAAAEQSRMLSGLRKSLLGE